MPRKATNFLEGVPRYKSLSVDADVVEKLGVIAEGLEAKFGFRPTVSQTLRHIMSSITLPGDD